MAYEIKDGKIINKTVVEKEYTKADLEEELSSINGMIAHYDEQKNLLETKKKEIESVLNQLN